MIDRPDAPEFGAEGDHVQYGRPSRVITKTSSSRSRANAKVAAPVVQSRSAERRGAMPRITSPKKPASAAVGVSARVLVRRHSEAPQTGEVVEDYAEWAHTRMAVGHRPRGKSRGVVGIR